MTSLARQPDPADPASVMIYSMGEVIGDGVIKLPFIAALRAAFPSSQIIWCAAGGQTVYATSLRSVVAGLIDEVLTAPPLGARAWDHLTLRPFGGRRFDLVIDTQGNVARGLFARRAARRFVSAVARFRLSDRRPARGAAWPASMTGRLETLLELARGYPTPLRPVALTDERALAAARALLPDGPRYVGFAPGAGGRIKRWPLDRYIALAARAKAEGLTPVFLMGPDEADEVAMVRAALPGALVPEFDRCDAYADVRGPLLVIALAARLAAAAANDAGPGHMLAAGGTPLVSLQRLRHQAVKFRPAARRLEMLIAEDFGGGMDALPVEAAWTALSRLLAAEP